MESKDLSPREYLCKRMQRLTHEPPEGIYESMHNMAIVRDREVYLRGLGFFGEDIDLCAYCAEECKARCGTDLTGVPSEEFGEYMDCECPISTLYFIAAGAAEMRLKLTMYEDACFDADGNETMTIDRLRELAKADAEGRVMVMPELPKCDKRNGKFCGNRTEQDEDEKDQCFHCCLVCDHAKEMDCTFVCETAAEHLHPSEDESEADAALAEKGETP